jgi:polyisoprenoid-binding protein YceI
MNMTKWEVDPMHSEVQFKAKHLMITTVTGHFRKFNLEVETSDDDFTKASKIIFTAEINSLDTNTPQRDAHLKSADFFNAEEYKEMKFVGKMFEKQGDHYLLHGDLTIRGTTKPISVNVFFNGIVVDPYGQTKAGFEVDGKLKRKDFGLKWDAITEAGKIVVSDEIKFHCEIQLIRKGNVDEVQREEEKQAVA